MQTMMWTQNLVRFGAMGSKIVPVSRSLQNSRLRSGISRSIGRLGEKQRSALSMLNRNLRSQKAMSAKFSTDNMSTGSGQILPGLSSTQSKTFSTEMLREPPALGHHNYGPREVAVNDQVQIRRAELSDYDCVVRLADIDGGQDYLFALYKDFVTDSDTYPLVATLDGKVVGFYMVTLFDGGRSVMRRAARVSEQHRGRGIYLRLEQELENYVRANCPRALSVGICKNDKDDAFTARFLAQGFQQVYRREGTQMIYKSSRVKLFTSKPGSSDRNMIQTRNITANELKLLFRSDKATEKLFPHGRLLNFYLNYRPLEENVRHLICDRGGAFVSLDLDTSDSDAASENSLESDALSISGYKQSSPYRLKDLQSPLPGFLRGYGSLEPLNAESVDKVAMVTFYYCYPTAAKPCFFLDAYARPGLGSVGDHFRAHLRQNLHTLQSFFPGQDAFLPVTFDPSIPKAEVMSSLHHAGIVDEKPEAEKWQILYERRQ